MDPNISRELYTAIENRELTLPDGWTFEDTVAYLEHSEKNDPANRRSGVAVPWAEELGRKFDKFADAFSRLASILPAMEATQLRRIAKAKKRLDKETALYGNTLINKQLFGLGFKARDLVDRNDLALGLLQKNEKRREYVKAKLKDTAVAALKIGLREEFEKAFKRVVGSLKGASENVVLNGLETFTKKFNEAMATYRTEQMKATRNVELRTSPKQNDEPPERPTVDEDEESPKAEKRRSKEEYEKVEQSLYTREERGAFKEAEKEPKKGKTPLALKPSDVKKDSVPKKIPEDESLEEHLEEKPEGGEDQ